MMAVEFWSISRRRKAASVLANSAKRVEVLRRELRWVSSRMDWRSARTTLISEGSGEGDARSRGLRAKPTTRMAAAMNVRMIP